jgi:hypothetical protein
MKDKKAAARTNSQTTLEQFAEAADAEGAADTTAAGAIEGAGAVEEAGGTARDVVAGTIGGAAAGAAGAIGENEPEGEDHVTAFERLIAKLVGIVENAEFTSGTLVGDIRDTMLDLFKSRPKTWSQMSEAEQRDTSKGLENVAKLLLRKLTIVIAEQDEVSVHATLKGYSVKGGAFKLNAEAKGDEETALRLFEMDGHAVVIMSAEAERFFGQRKDADVLADQPTLPLASDAPASASPADNSDLDPDAPEAEDKVESESTADD